MCVICRRLFKLKINSYFYDFNHLITISLSPYNYSFEIQLFHICTYIEILGKIFCCEI